MSYGSERELLRAPASERVQRSVLRRTLLAASTFLLAVPGAYLVWSVRPVSYTAEGTLWIVAEAPRGGSEATPEGARSVLESGAWIELLRSSEVLDPVVAIRANDRGSARSRRDAARELSQRLTVSTDREGRVIRVALEGPDPQETVRILNAVMDRTVDVAGRLKRARLNEVVNHLEAQLEAVQDELERTKHDLEEFGVGTIGVSESRSSSLNETEPPEARLRMRVEVSENLYNAVRGRLARARLAAASSTPDLQVLERASVPERPTHGRRLPIAAAILLASLGLVGAGALLLDRSGGAASTGL